MELGNHPKSAYDIFRREDSAGRFRVKNNMQKTRLPLDSLVLICQNIGT